MKETFELRAAAHKHAFADCISLDDFLRLYRTAPYGNDIRALVFFLCNDLWGKGCFVIIEKNIMDKLKLRYKNELVSGAVPKTRRKSGSIKVMLVRMKQTYFIERFRHIGFEVHHEVIYKRHMMIHRSEGVVHVVKVTRASHGYDGFLGLCVGHPCLLDKTVMSPAKHQKTDAQMSDIMQFLVEKARSNSTMTASDILAVWTRTSAKPVEVTVTNSFQSLSAVSNVSDQYTYANQPDT